jgi:hypothetical protein
MSTQINIRVDSGGLSDRAKQQQQAARQAQLEKERTLNLSAEALNKRTAAQAAKGLSIDGQPLYNPAFKQPDIERRPAANRFGQFDFGEGYFNVARGANNIASVTVRSGNKAVVLTVNLAGSEKPVGFRDRAGEDKLPALSGSTESLPYLSISGGGYSQIRHVGYRRDGAGSFVRIDASNAASGGWAQFESTVYSDLIVLPITANTAVFAYSERRHSYKTYTYHEEVFSSVAGDLGNGTVTESVPVAEGREDITKAAFLVGYNSVKQISYPETLYQTARQVELIPPFTLAREDLSATGMQSFISWNDPPLINLRLAYTGIGTEYSLGNAFYEGLQQAEIISWGLKSDERLYESAASTRVSPGIYDALRGASIPFYSFPDNPRFADVQQQVNARGQQFKWFRVKYNADPSLTKAQIYTQPLPEYYSFSSGTGTDFQESGFVNKNLKGNRLILAKQSGETYYRWTDWNDSNYCRSQAAALGFSSADLTP